MAEQQITGQHEQAVQRLRSLFHMHQVPFGAPEHLGELLLSIHENRLFAMDFWSLVNSLSDSGNGVLGHSAMLEAVVESSTGADTNSLPASERPGLEELRQLLAGVDVPGSFEPTRKIEPPRSPSTEDLMERRRSIGETLAKLEENTRELRVQLAQLDTQMFNYRTTDQAVIRPALDEVKIAEQQKSESTEKMSQAGSPMAEAAPPSHMAESQPPAKAPFAAAASTQSIAQHATPAESATTNKLPEPVPVAVFDHRPASMLGHRGFAIPDPDDDPRISAPFSKYSDDEEHSPLKRLMVPAIILILLVTAAFAAIRTETGRVWLQRALDSLRNTYNSATVDRNETPPPPASEMTSSTTQAASNDLSAPAPAAPLPSSTQEPPSQGVRSSDTPSDEAFPVQEKVVNEGALRVPASTMAANLITSRVPAYPEPARTRGIEGTVIMDVVISATGTVKDVRIIEGDSHLRAAAQDAVLRWRYKPYQLNGEPVEVTTTVTLDFHLSQ